MPEYRSVNHVAFATNDMDMTIRFWRDLLGMRLIAGHGEPGNRQYFFEITEHMMVSFFEWPDVGPVPDKDAGYPVKGPYSFDHICIETADHYALWELKDMLSAADIWVSEIMDNGFIHSLFSTDPNNIQLEFCCRIEGVDLSKNPVLLDKEPSAVILEGPDPQPGIWPEVKVHTPQGERKIYPGSLKKLTEQ
jgi:catechol 2,3-dioxygenase-like lactoylglutathione lyase family enzyme